jgi:hypothetical protein
MNLGITPTNLRSEFFTVGVASALFHQIVLESGIRKSLELDWLTTRTSLSGVHSELDMAQVWFEEDPHGAEAILCSSAHIIRVSLQQDRLHVVLVAENPVALELQLRGVFPEKAIEEGAPFRFWFWDACRNSPSSKVRLLKGPTWGDVSANYTKSVRLQLQALVSDFEPARGGQLLLWNGDPGTGKTHAIKALAREWKEWCSFEYVTDPDALFGHASYLINVMLDHPDDEKWRVLVLEDTGELMRPDARTEMGQGLSRLLNVVDGLIGQGLKTLLLVTTNELLQRLHPAVSRPGRCASQIEFQPLGADEARGWLSARGHERHSGATPTHLSDLFALVDSFVNDRRQSSLPLGFACR